MTFRLNGSFRKKLARKAARAIVRAIHHIKKPADHDDQPPWPIVPLARIAQARNKKRGPSPKEMRAGYRLSTYLFHMDDAPMAKMAQFDVGHGLQLRMYWPHQVPQRAGAPAMMFMHGGGFVIGDLETHDTTCRFLAERANVVVFALDYRLAPEHKFPAALEDVKTAFNWLHDHADMLGIDPQNIGAGGDSAGARAALALGLEAISPHLPGAVPSPAWLWMVYPATDLYAETPSLKEFNKDLFLTTPVMKWFGGQFLSEEVLANPEPDNAVYAPLRSPDLGKLPPSYLMTVGFDPLRDEGIMLRDRLQDEGIPLEYAHYPHLAHEIFAISGIVPEARAAVEEAGDALGRLVRGSTARR